MSDNIHSGHRERLREIANKIGLENMPEHQVLEIILSFVIPQKDTNPLAHDLIRTFGSLSGVLDARKSELENIKGIGSKTATFLHSYVEIFTCYKKSKMSDKVQIKNTISAYNHIKPLLEYKTNEELLLLCIDSKNNLISCERLEKGVGNGSSVDIQKITTLLLNSKCCNFILAHNHPSGKVVPSLEDDKFTKAVAIAMTINGFNFLDHIIVGRDEFFSYNQQGNLQELNEIGKKLMEETFPTKKIIAETPCLFNINEE